jgi:hypothetical protein
MIKKLSFLATTALIGSLGAAAAQNPSLGWHYFHPAYCQSVEQGSVGSGDYSLTLFAVEGGIWLTHDPGFMQMLYPACQTGNWVGVMVGTMYNAWFDVQLFPYK